MYKISELVDLIQILKILKIQNSLLSLRMKIQKMKD
jgi:hypothetical protein